jgi:hypothetical protein
MERARATWTDERLDDLAQRMDRGFERVDRELVGLSGRIDALSDRLDARIDALQRTMIQVGGGLVAAMLATLATVLVAVIATQA